MNVLKTCRRLLLALAAVLGFAGLAGAAEQVQEWELIIPNGVIEQAQIDPARRIAGLDGKTVVLRWNGKNNGNVFLDRVAELFAQKHPKTKVVKSYTDTRLNTITGSPAQSEFVTKSILAMKPDLVIAAQAD